MKRFLLLFLSFLFVCFGLVATASAQDGADVQVVCPTSVTAGTALTVTVTPYNYNCTGSVTFNRAMVALGGNSGGTLGGAGIWGPYNKTLTAWIIPAATCDGFGNVISPGVGQTRSQKIIGVVPPALGGTVAMAMFSFLSSSGESLSGGTCMVNVVPVP